MTQQQYEWSGWILPIGNLHFKGDSAVTSKLEEIEAPNDLIVSGVNISQGNNELKGTNSVLAFKWEAYFNERVF